jgi:hypothetical protein
MQEKTVMSRVIVCLAVITLSLSTLAQEKNKDVAFHSTATEQHTVKVTLTTVAPMLGPPTNRYHVGEQIPVTINLTNTSNEPLYSCLSGDAYQDLPTLTRDGKVVSYTGSQKYLLETAQKDQTCLHENLPDSTLLMPHQPTIVDSLIVMDDSEDPTGAIAWYERLTPGKYELSVQRRFGCCDGPMVESNKVRFEVIP